MIGFKEFFITEFFPFPKKSVPEPSDIPEKTVEHIRLIMAEIIKEYGISSYVSFETVNDKSLDVLFTGDDAKGHTDLINKLISKKYPFITVSPTAAPGSITLSLFV